MKSFICHQQPVFVHCLCISYKVTCFTWKQLETTGQTAQLKLYDASRFCKAYWLGIRTVVQTYMAQSPHFGLYWPFTNLPFGICAIYFVYTVSQYIGLSGSSRTEICISKKHMTYSIAGCRCIIIHITCNRQLQSWNWHTVDGRNPAFTSWGW